MNKFFQIEGVLFALASVILGASFAHRHSTTDPKDYEALQTGLRYLMVHSVAIFFGASEPALQGWIGLAGLSLISLGIFLFSGSLFIVTRIRGTALRYVTPVGGSILILGWIFILWAVMIS
ncbi:DUF423 domain-containing protein [Estrella lausannensis]|uniref:Conserved putative membrane protein n=1 Tax=Estrella lausannensis TaxID=483423 RepID=A0A0H5DQ86_9BACT|nr:DUF423 domain-containing protein [Estrella lausannensis]CRX38662.1 Conserved putative membrane protein [Estrella lausannensis]